MACVIPGAEVDLCISELDVVKDQTLACSDSPRVSLKEAKLYLPSEKFNCLSQKMNDEQFFLVS